MAEGLCQVLHNRPNYLAHLKDAFREGIPEVGARSVPAGGRIRPVPGRLGYHGRRH
jgi:hypothetical protein